MIIAKNSQWKSKEIKNFKYSISYSTDDTFVYLKSEQLIDTYINSFISNYYRHYLTKVNQDVSINLFVSSGNPYIYVSASSDNKKPNNISNDFSSSL